MIVEATDLPGVVVLEVPVRRDERGHFLEAWRRDRYAASGLGWEFVQDNVSSSRRGVVRGLHYQEPGAQGKLVAPLVGTIYDVAVDIRAGSPTFGRWVGVTLEADRGRQIYVPEGFAHGFAVTSPEALVLYKSTRPYDPTAEGAILWSDPDLAIAWPEGAETLSARDRAAPRLAEVPRHRLPVYRGPSAP